MSDDDIDTSDIPEITDAQAKTAHPGSQRKTTVEIALGSGLVAWMKNTPEDGDLETQVNRILRQHVIGQIRKASS